MALRERELALEETEEERQYEMMRMAMRGPAARPSSPAPRSFSDGGDVPSQTF